MIVVTKGGMNMADVREVFITKEIADKFDMSPNYIIKIARSLDLNESEMREAGKRTYLFSNEAVNKIGERLKNGK